MTIHLFYIQKFGKYYKRINPNKAGHFEGRFFWGGGGQFDPPIHISRIINLILI